MLQLRSKNDVNYYIDKFEKTINDFKNSKGTVNRQIILELSTRTNFGGKNFENRYIDGNMAKRTGQNTNPIIINIDNIFDGVTKKNAPSFWKDAIDKAKSLLNGKEINIIDTNTNVDINMSGIKETYQPRKQLTPEKIQSSGKMEDIIKQGIYAYTTDNIDGKPQILHNFYSAINYNKENKLMRVVIKESTDGSFKKTKFYYHQLELIDNDITKNTSLNRQGICSKPVVSNVFSISNTTTNTSKSKVALSNNSNMHKNKNNLQKSKEES